MFELTSKKIVVTGGGGFLGSGVVKELQKEGVRDIIIPRSREFDLREKEVCEKVVTGCDVLIHVAAHVGGIGLNQAHPGQLFYDNAAMGLHLLEAARQAGVKKTVIIGTACVYPKYCPVPFHEEDLWAGYPDEITGVYGLSKKLLLVQAQAYRKEYGFNAIFLIPVNLYGPGDNFDADYGHVIPSLILRMFEAKKKRQNKFVVWGSGIATREFLYVEDAARGIVQALKQYDGGEPVNLGTGREISIKDLVLLLKKIFNYRGEIVWDETKPDGQPRRAVDVTRAKEWFDFTAQTNLEDGLTKTIAWYICKFKSEKLKVKSTIQK